MYASLNRLLSNRSASTQRSYIVAMTLWSVHLGEQYGTKACERAWKQANSLDVVSFVSFLKSRVGQKNRDANGSNALSGRTMRQRLISLRTLYKALVSTGEFKSNPFFDPGVRFPNKFLNEKRVTESVEFDKVKELLESPSRHTAEGIRDRAILACMFGGALRKDEARLLRLDDIRTTPNGTMFLVLRSTKTGRDYHQPLPLWACLAMTMLVLQRRREGATGSDFAFVMYRRYSNQDYRSVSSKTFYRLFKRLCASVGLPKTISPHSARATAITRLLAEGLSHFEVQKFSRHSSVQQVEIYDKRRIGLDENAARLVRY